MADIIVLEKMNKFYGTYHALKDVDLTIAKGEKVVVCGPSGSGKSTMIRCINRLEEHDSGRITVAGAELTDDEKKIDLVRREVVLVFQSFNHFPHMTVL
jgi:general L-amino acid transport system ATP-binding protein